MDATKDSNIHVLEDAFFNLGDWHIYGCTLWTDLALHGDPAEGANVAGRGMNDYKRIRNSARKYRRLSPDDTRQIHLRSIQRLTEFFSNHDARKTLVITHHAPSALSLAIEHRTDPIRCAYASNLDGFIRQYQPRLWIHGHIHHSNDYFIGETRVISNPQGNLGDLNPGFIPDLVIEV